MKQTFLVTIETLKSAILPMELETTIFDELSLMYYHPSVEVVEIGKVDSESAEADEYFDLKKHAEDW
jgi:hypothetical protein